MPKIVGWWGGGEEEGRGHEWIHKSREEEGRGHEWIHKSREEEGRGHEWIHKSREEEGRGHEWIQNGQQVGREIPRRGGAWPRVDREIQEGEAWLRVERRGGARPRGRGMGVASW